MTCHQVLHAGDAVQGAHVCHARMTFRSCTHVADRISSSFSRLGCGSLHAPHRRQQIKILVALNPQEGCLNACSLRGLHCALCLHFGEALQGQATTCNRMPRVYCAWLWQAPPSPPIAARRLVLSWLTDQQGDFGCDLVAVQVNHNG